MNTPNDPISAWGHLRNYASAQLPENFADHVLRAARQQASGDAASFWGAEFMQTFFLSAGTAIACLLLVIIIHTNTNRSTSLEHLADWEEITMQTASLDSSP